MNFDYNIIQCMLFILMKYYDFLEKPYPSNNDVLKQIGF
ncbi:hypothetical protein LLB_1629 [Legionella longbeachae D-4968]|nr:hypothetical protein LLB_1629 [Legionella longbeachae D-4968]